MKSTPEPKKHAKEVVEETPVEKPVATPKAKAATEPWSEAYHKQQGLLGVRNQKEGHNLRWVRHDSVDRRKNQGYTLATPSDFDATPDENGMIRRNELVLMVIPSDIYDARRAEVKRQTELQASSAKQEFIRERDLASKKSGHNLRTRDDRDEE